MDEHTNGYVIADFVNPGNHTQHHLLGQNFQSLKVRYLQADNPGKTFHPEWCFLVGVFCSDDLK